MNDSPTPLEFERFLRDDEVTIYLFHGVIPEPHSGVRNYTHKHLDAGAFRNICAALRTEGKAVSLDDALGILAQQRPMVHRPFVITFDDGFRNNVTVAAPILEDLQLPAMFYVTTGFLESNGASWTDLIEEAVERTRVENLTLPWEDRPRLLRTDADRVAVLNVVREAVKTDPQLDGYEVADAIRERADVGSFLPDPFLDQKMSWEEARALDSSELFTVGGHGHTHRILSFLDPEELENELSTSLDLLNRRLGHPVRHYSYPEGLPHCYSQRVIDALRRRGIVSAPTAEPGANALGADPFRLKRVMVPLPEMVLSGDQLTVTSGA